MLCCQHDEQVDYGVLFVLFCFEALLMTSPNISSETLLSFLTTSSENNPTRAAIPLRPTMFRLLASDPMLNTLLRIRRLTMTARPAPIKGRRMYQAVHDLSKSLNCPR